MRKVQSSVYSWPAIERMMRIHRLIENKEYPNCTKIVFGRSILSSCRSNGLHTTGAQKGGESEGEGALPMTFYCCWSGFSV